MVNCYRVCRADFEETVGMVGSARGLSSDEVKEVLDRLKAADGDDYKALRRQLPEQFPL
jgi:hypothetical protein